MMVIFQIIEKIWVEYLFILGWLELDFFGSEDGLSYLLEIASNDLLVKCFTIRIIYESCFGAKLTHT